MTEEHIAHLAEHLSSRVEDTVRKTVNGKIDALSKDFKEHKDEMQPILDAYKAANRVGAFVIWLSKIILALGIIVGVIFTASKVK